MSKEEFADATISFNPKFCTLLRRGHGPTASPPQPGRLKRLVGSAVVQRLRQKNYQLAVEEFLHQPDAPPRVPEEVALNYFVRRTYNSLRSREMLTREAQEAARLGREPYAQTLAKDISRRHFRTAARFDTGSKYPPGGDPDLHSRAAQDPVLTLLHSRKLLAMADVLLTHPGSLRVGPQLGSLADTDATRSRQREGDDRGAHVTAADDLGYPRDASGTRETRARGSVSAPGELEVPSLDATRYALALYSPRHGYRSPEEPSSSKGTIPEGFVRHVRRNGAREVRARRVGVPQPRDAARGEGSGEAGGSDQRPARQLRGAVGEAFLLAVAEEKVEAEESPDPDTADSGDSGTEVTKGAEGAAGQASREEEEDGNEIRIRADEAQTETGPQQDLSDGARSSPRGAASSGGSDRASDSAASVQVLPGGGREALPVGVRQQLLVDRLQELLAGSRGLLAQAESVLGTGE